jgi:hypothetical protein
VDGLTVATTFICDKCHLTIFESMIRSGEAKRTAGERGTSMSIQRSLDCPTACPCPKWPSTSSAQSATSAFGEAPSHLCSWPSQCLLNRQGQSPSGPHLETCPGALDWRVCAPRSLASPRSYEESIALRNCGQTPRGSCRRAAGQGTFKPRAGGGRIHDQTREGSNQLHRGP